MKRFFILVFALILGTLPGVRDLGAQEAVSLDDAIGEAAAELGRVIARGSKVAALNFSGGSDRFSNYVIEELTGAIVNQRILTAVDRQQLDLIRREMNFQQSGEVSDESAPEIGRLLGAQTIISGSLESIGAVYRFRIRAIEVRSASIQVSYAKNIQNDSIVQALLGSPAAGSAPPPAASAPPPAAAPVVPADAYRDFSTARRVGAGFLNWIYGLGSFTMGDWLGGGLILAADVGGLVLIIQGSSTGSIYGGYGYYYGGEPNYTKLGIGAGLIVGATIFGHIRPFHFHRRQPRYSALENFDIAMVPGREGVEGVRFSYGFSY
ncbi:MAG: hypothetical protein LBL43_06455 [Treponema sp.]|jgi:hypothetical protein|nr:hypothetical protein [Treponema sp.]